MDDLTITVDGEEYQVRVEETPEGKFRIYCGKDIYEVQPQPSSRLPKLDFGKEGTGGLGEGAAVAPLPGVVLSISVTKGDKVKKGQGLLKLVAMKMENEVTAPIDGTVKEIYAKKDEGVNKGDVLVLIE